jgi:uncharacterized damage-inducible protein DinB
VVPGRLGPEHHPRPGRRLLADDERRKVQDYGRRVQRTDPPNVADERPMLSAWLGWHRATLLTKCDGLDAEQLRARPVATSLLSLHGLVRHMAEVERNWFRRRLAGQDAPKLYGGGDADFDGAVPDPQVVAEAWAAWRAEVAFAERFVAEAPNLDLSGPDATVLREVLVHMIEEYARHNGHADFLRERIDGRVGQ